MRMSSVPPGPSAPSTEGEVPAARLSRGEALGLALIVALSLVLHLTYVLLGATTMFAQAAEAKLLTGRDPRDASIVEEYADLIVRLLLPGSSSAPP